MSKHKYLLAALFLALAVCAVTGWLFAWQSWASIDALRQNVSALQDELQTAKVQLDDQKKTLDDQKATINRQAVELDALRQASDNIVYIASDDLRTFHEDSECRMILSFYEPTPVDRAYAIMHGYSPCLACCH